MKALRVAAAFAAASLVLAGLGSCKPIGYYLDKVYKVHGQVTVDGTSPPEPIGSVEVFLGDWQYSELTNCNGDYEMEMAAGTWTINFAKDGYLPKSVEGVRVDSDNPRYMLNVALTPVQPEGLLTVTGKITIEAGLWSDPVGTRETILIGIDTHLLDLVTLDISNIDHNVLPSMAHEEETYSYSISGVPAGTYYLAAAIDMNGDGEVNLGDYAGIYGNLDPGDPTDPADDPPANVAIDADHTVFDFSIEQFSWEPYGTWENTRYNADGEEPGPMARLVFLEGQDGDPDVVELYENTGDTTAAQTIQFEITDHWVAGQAQWFLFPVDMGAGIMYFVMRISAEDTVLEIASSSDDTRPAEIDPDTSDTYVTYSRQEQ